MNNNIKTIRCPYCGAYDKIKNNNNKYKCGYCDCEFYLVNDKNKKILEDAHNYLIRYKFDDADDLYRSLIRDSIENKDDELYVMAEWGRLLAYFGVVYIKGFDSNVSIPTFSKYDNRFNTITNSEHFMNIMESNVSNNIKLKYEEMANKLDLIYKKIGVDLRKTPQYDLFLCVKISLKTYSNPNLVGYTRDSKLADKIFDELTKRGYKVFYSDKCCQGIEYDSQILSALSMSKLLLVISTTSEYLESPWVQSEWRRWLNFIQWGEKDKTSLLLFLPNYENGFELPVILTKKKIQYFDNSLDVINHVVESLGSKDIIKNDKIINVQKYSANNIETKSNSNNNEKKLISDELYYKKSKHINEDNNNDNVKDIKSENKENDDSHFVMNLFVISLIIFFIMALLTLIGPFISSN